MESIILPLMSGFVEAFQPLNFGMLVLGPLAEPALRQSLLASQGEFTIFFTRPISAICMAAAAALVVYPLIQTWWRRRNATPAEA